MLHRQKLAKDLLFHFDWIGVLLYSAGLILMIFGLNWGGVLYPWSSGPVLGTIIVGGILLFFVLPAYEIWIQKRGKEPYLPIHLFKNPRFMAASWNNGFGACVYYGFGIVFPQVVNNVYYARGEISRYDIGTLAGLTAMAFVFAQVFHGPIVWFTGPKWAARVSSACGCALLTSCAADLGNKNTTIGLLVPGAFCMGLVEAVSTTTATFHLRSQEEIGEGGKSCTIHDVDTC